MARLANPSAAEVLVLFAWLCSLASAVQFNGTPELSFRVDRPAHDYVEGSVGLTKVRVMHCGGGYTDVAVNQVFDPVETQVVAIPSGNHCALWFYWSTDLDVDGPSWTVRYEEPITVVVLDTPIPVVQLTPYTVVSGTMSGGGPRLHTAIQ